MAYCRWGDQSDLYVIHNNAGYLECIGCDSAKLHGDKSFTTKHRNEMISHLLKHKDMGDNVPDDAIIRIQEEILDLGRIVDPWVKS